ncbi:MULTISPECIES: nuclear transport factor 2 family protein [unclassified Roseovarius]|uniref:nuclear transport factor 2 family protein n=1 Tax=unclassified Roseovarius TaxID=2614913 RepID=UPI00273D0B57|nr:MULTISPECIES: nuclear transport factor 2 family protein [unclassified Roseovarius]
MQLSEIAQELVAGCREDRQRANLEKLYAPDAVSVEAADLGQGREAKGVEAIKAKHDWWESTMEVAEAHVSDPMPHGEDRFAVIFRMTAGEKGSGQMMDMEEVALYTVADGKIVREEFFYAMPDA